MFFSKKLSREELLQKIAGSDDKHFLKKTLSSTDDPEIVGACIHRTAEVTCSLFSAAGGDSKKRHQAVNKAGYLRAALWPLFYEKVNAMEDVCVLDQLLKEDALDGMPELACERLCLRIAALNDEELKQYEEILKRYAGGLEETLFAAAVSRLKDIDFLADRYRWNLGDRKAAVKKRLIELGAQAKIRQIDQEEEEDRRKRREREAAEEAARVALEKACSQQGHDLDEHCNCRRCGRQGLHDWGGRPWEDGGDVCIHCGIHVKELY